MTGPRDDLDIARAIADRPDEYSAVAIRNACDVLENSGLPRDFFRALDLRQSLGTDEPDDGSLPIAWAIVFAFVIGAAAGLAGWLVWHLLSAIDWQPILQFIAPTAFDDRPIEALIAGQP